MFQWLIDFVLALFSRPRKVKITGRVSMPLSYPKDGGGYRLTWDYLSKSDLEQDQCRWWIKQLSEKNETPAIAFLLSPSDESGNLFDDGFNVSADNLQRAKRAIERCVKDGIACFAVLYTDDKPPWWYDIGKHVSTWKAIHSVIGKHINGYLLSIESNEQVTSVGQLQDCIATLQKAMPGAGYYGTHLQWKAKSLRSQYKWHNDSSIPSNANLILAEASWTPYSGYNASFDMLRAEAESMLGGSGGRAVCFHEYNLNAGGVVMPKQRDVLRTVTGLWGQG